jgi:3-hydroxyisobutyrate dehydrogenase
MHTIGFIGLGTVGAVIAKNLQRAGYPLVVHDIRPEATAAFKGSGVEVAASPAHVARASAVVLSSLPGPPEVAEVALGAQGLLHGLREGAIYVDLSSSSVDLIRRIAAEFQLHGASVLDAPLILGKAGIANKSVQILVSGALEVFDRVKPLLEAFGDTVVYTGELGTGTVIKLAHNLVRRGIGLAIGEGIVLGAKAGVDPEMLWQCMHWGLDVQLHQLQKSLPATVFNDNFDAPAGFGLGLARKDVGLATALARQHNVPMPISALVEQTMVQALNRGWSEQSTLSLFRLQEEAAGIEVRTKSK